MSLVACWVGTDHSASLSSKQTAYSYVLHKWEARNRIGPTRGPANQPARRPPANPSTSEISRLSSIWPPRASGANPVLLEECSRSTGAHMTSSSPRRTSTARVSVYRLAASHHPIQVKPDRLGSLADRGLRAGELPRYLPNYLIIAPYYCLVS